MICTQLAGRLGVQYMISAQLAGRLGVQYMICTQLAGRLGIQYMICTQKEVLSTHAKGAFEVDELMGRKIFLCQRYF